jgi:hypothetical protein
MRMVWQYGDAAKPAGQQAREAGELGAVLAVLHRRAAAAGWAHSVVLSADGRLPRRAARGAPAPAWAGAGPRPRLTVVVGADLTPLWWEPTGGGQQVSISPRPAGEPEPEPDGLFTFHSGGELHTIPAMCLVPREQAWQAARMFLTSGSRPAIITWHSLPPYGPASPEPREPGHTASAGENFKR